MSLAAYSGMKPIDSLTVPRRRRLIQEADRQVLSHRLKLTAEDARDYYVYLLDGTVKVQSPAGCEQFDANSDRAKMPIFTDPNRTETAVAQAESRIIKVSRRRYVALREEQAGDAESGYEVSDVGAVDLEADILKRLFDDYQKDCIPVPGMPEAAVRVRQLVDDPDVSIMALARIIEQDPALAGKLVAASNSALTGGQTVIGSVKGALVRMGIKPSCTLITAVAMKGLFEFSDSKLRDTATQVWRHSLRVGATARALAGMCPCRADPDKAFLVGLLHDIGAVTMLTYFTEHRPSAGAFAVGGSMRELCAMVSGMILQKWSMDIEFVQAAEGTGIWDVAGADNVYVDLLNLAKQQVYRVNQPEIEVPAVEETAAYQALAPAGGIEDGVIVGLADHPDISAALNGLS